MNALIDGHLGLQKVLVIADQVSGQLDYPVQFLKSCHQKMRKLALRMTFGPVLPYVLMEQMTNLSGRCVDRWVWPAAVTEAFVSSAQDHDGKPGRFSSIDI